MILTRSKIPFSMIAILTYILLIRSSFTLCTVGNNNCNICKNNICANCTSNNFLLTYLDPISAINTTTCVACGTGCSKCTNEIGCSVTITGYFSSNVSIQNKQVLQTSPCLKNCELCSSSTTCDICSSSYNLINDGTVTLCQGNFDTNQFIKIESRLSIKLYYLHK